MASKNWFPEEGILDTNCAIYGAIRGYGDDLELKLDDYLDEAPQTILERKILNSIKTFISKNLFQYLDLKKTFRYVYGDVP